MNKKEALKLFKEIQNGRGSWDLFDKFPQKGTLAKWTPEFSLGHEYGILSTLDIIFNITGTNYNEN